MGRLLFKLGAGFFIILAAIFSFYFLSAGPLKTEKTIIIPPGTQIIETSKILYSKQVISSPYIFNKIFVILRNFNFVLKAGQYSFYPGISIKNIISILDRGKSINHKFTIIEGERAQDIIKKIEKISILTGEITISVPEGYMMPDTYFYNYGQSKNDLVKMAKSKMENYLSSTNIGNNKQLKNKKDLLVLASMIEKETNIMDEMSYISAVYSNRLRKRMRLQSCPTVIYGIIQKKGKFDQALSTKDLKFRSKYNTYRNYGLPPTPICCPSRAAIIAAANPANVNLLFFVAAGGGSHAFAKDFAQHKKNRRKYQN